MFFIDFQFVYPDVSMTMSQSRFYCLLIVSLGRTKKPAVNRPGSHPVHCFWFNFKDNPMLREERVFPILEPWGIMGMWKNNHRNSVNLPVLMIYNHHEVSRSTIWLQNPHYIYICLNFIETYQMNNSSGCQPERHKNGDQLRQPNGRWGFQYVEVLQNVWHRH